MVRNQAPCIANCFRLPEDLPQSFQKVIPVGIASEYRPPFNASDHDVVERTRSVDSRFPWHAAPLSPPVLLCQLKNLTASPFSPLSQSFDNHDFILVLSQLMKNQI